MTGIGDQVLRYPPIANAARVYGVVLERVIYLPNGTVQSFEFISGPKMLSGGLEQQMRTWPLKTNATGDAACESLVIARFDLDDSSGMSKSYPLDVSFPSILGLKVTATPVCLCDPEGVVKYSPFQRVGNTIRKIFRRLFPSRKSQSL